MRYLTAAALFAFLAAMAGCGSPEPLAPGPATCYSPPNNEQLKQKASEFHNKESNAKVSGEQVPLQFLDMEGKAVDLASFRGTSNVLLVVVKGLPQTTSEPYKGQFCPGCLAQVNALAANYDKFKAKDTEILMVFPGPTDSVGQFLADGHVDGTGDNLKLPFRLLRDTDLNAVTALGISGDLARPSTYILDKKGNAVFAYVGAAGAGTTDRPSVQALLDRLDKLNAKK